LQNGFLPALSFYFDNACLLAAHHIVMIVFSRRIVTREGQHIFLYSQVIHNLISP
jgi:hypothetical protein